MLPACISDFWMMTAGTTKYKSRMVKTRIVVLKTEYLRFSLIGAAVGVTGITLTKLDGTAKGGVIFAMAQQLKLPIRFIGVGEQAEDLRPFEAKEFIDALFSEANLSDDNSKESDS